jgi:hypothetical protein
MVASEPISSVESKPLQSTPLADFASSNRKQNRAGSVEWMLRNEEGTHAEENSGATLCAAATRVESGLA